MISVFVFALDVVDLLGDVIDETADIEARTRGLLIYPTQYRRGAAVCLGMNDPRK